MTDASKFALGLLGLLQIKGQLGIKATYAPHLAELMGAKEPLPKEESAFLKAVPARLGTFRSYADVEALFFAQLSHRTSALFCRRHGLRPTMRELPFDAPATQASHWVQHLSHVLSVLDLQQVRKRMYNTTKGTDAFAHFLRTFVDKATATELATYVASLRAMPHMLVHANDVQRLMMHDADAFFEGMQRHTRVADNVLRNVVAKLHNDALVARHSWMA